MEIYVKVCHQDNVIDHGRVLNNSILGVLQNYTSLQWLANFQKSGEFSITANATKENLEILKEGNNIYRQDIDRYGIILNVEATEKTITCKGYLDVLDKQVNRRTVSITNIFNGLQEILGPLNIRLPIYSLVASSAVKQLSIGAMETTYATVQKTVIDLCQKLDLGYQINSWNKIELYQGKDLTKTEAFGDEIETIINQKLIANITKMHNVAIVAGAGEGAERVVVEVPNPNYPIDDSTPYSELFVDARDISRTYKDGAGNDVEYTLDEYTKLLNARGLQKLLELGKGIDFKCDYNVKDMYKFRRDFNVGDVVKVRSRLFNMTFSMRITSAKEIFENGYIKLQITLTTT